jgi:hypothetical protein
MTADQDPDRLFPDTCDVCGARLGPAEGTIALVRDSSAVRSHAGGVDGQRLVLACTAEHGEVLRARYLQRPFAEEELWAGRIRRALGSAPGLGPVELAARTGLSPEQIEQGQAWIDAHPAIPSQNRCDGTPPQT